MTELIVDSPISWQYSLLVLVLDELRMSAQHSEKLTRVIHDYLEDPVTGGPRSASSVYSRVTASALRVSL